jgi:hypothetical protein
LEPKAHGLDARNFYGCGTESQGCTYWVRWYAARELRFSMLTVPVKREVVRLTTTGPFTVCGSFSFAQTELLSSSLWRRLLCENRNRFLSIKYSVLTEIFVLITQGVRIRIRGICRRADWRKMEMLRLCAVDGAFPPLPFCCSIVLPFTISTIVCMLLQIF